MGLYREEVKSKTRGMKMAREGNEILRVVDYTDMISRVIFHAKSCLMSMF